MRLVLPLALLLLAACGRPLSPGEAQFVSRMHGETLDLSRVRLVNGALIGEATYPRRKRPRLACRERILPEPQGDTVTVSPAGVTLFNHVFLAHDWYERDFMPDYPQRMDLTNAMLLAHEVTHVWQWQNRKVTGYTPWGALREHRRGTDPYLFKIDTSTAFLDYGYEQQASIVEEYVCCAVLDPEAPRTHRLATLLRGAFPMQSLARPNEVWLPWKDAKVRGICH